MVQAKEKAPSVAALGAQGKTNHYHDTTPCQQRLHRLLLANGMYRLGFQLASELIQEGALADCSLGLLREMMLSYLSRGAAFFQGVANALRELIKARRLAL